MSTTGEWTENDRSILSKVHSTPVVIFTIVMRRNCTLAQDPCTFFHQVLIEEAAQDGGRDVAVGQQNPSQHGQLVLLRLCEAFEEQQQLPRGKTDVISNRQVSCSFSLMF